jgi:C4-dicarboxylate transporter DctQ subunit
MVKTLLNVWNWTEKFLTGLLALLALILAFYAVVMRYVFNNAPEWSEEYIMYMIIWAVFLVSSTLAEERGHVGATFVVERFPPKLLRVVEIITGFLALGFCVLICVKGYQIVWIAFVTDERSLTSMRNAMWYVYLAIPFGGTLIGGRYIKRIYQLLFRFDPSDLLGAHEMSHKAQLKQDLPENP